MPKPLGRQRNLADDPGLAKPAILQTIGVCPHRLWLGVEREGVLTRDCTVRPCDFESCSPSRPD